MTIVRATIAGVKIVFDDDTMIALPDRALVELLNVSADAQREGKFEQSDEILREVVNAHALIELPIEVLCPLPQRLLHSLWNRDYSNVDEIVRAELPDLRRVKNFGRVSMSLIGTRLRALKLNLTGQCDYTWIGPLQMQLRERWRLIPTFVWEEPHPIWTAPPI